MARETDVWQTAWIIANEYGDEGIEFAAQMARSFHLGGKLEAERVWLSIMEKVNALTSGQDAPQLPPQ